MVASGENQDRPQILRVVHPLSSSKFRSSRWSIGKVLKQWKPNFVTTSRIYQHALPSLSICPFAVAVVKLSHVMSGIYMSVSSSH